MSAVNEWIVREYFEANGYFVHQPRKYEIQGKRKEVKEEIDLIVINPLVSEHKVPDHFIWSTDDLKSIQRAVVAIKGWHTERFYASKLEKMPEILRFVEPKAIEFAHNLLGDGPVAKILCIPALPASGELKEVTIKTLKNKGVDGIISFGTILMELVGYVTINRSYKSDLLQILRLLKRYDLIKDIQMDFFIRRRRIKKESKNMQG